MHHDRRPALARGLHGPQDLAVVAVEDAGVGHEQLEAGDALVLGEVLHGLERLVVDAADDLVEAVVDGAVAVGLGVPGGQAVDDAGAGGLHREVDDGGDAAPRRGDGAGLERVGRGGAAEGQLHVGVHVDAARDDVLAGGVDDLVGGGLGGREPAGGADRGDGLAVDQHVVGDAPAGADDGAVLDQDRAHGCLLIAGPARRRRRAGGPGRTASRRGPRGSWPGRGRARSARACAGRPRRRRTGRAGRRSSSGRRSRRRRAARCRCG